MSPPLTATSQDIRQLLDPDLSIEARGVLGWMIAGGGDPFAWSETYKVACAIAELTAAGYVREGEGGGGRVTPGEGLNTAPGCGILVDAETDDAGALCSRVALHNPSIVGNAPLVCGTHVPGVRLSNGDQAGGGRVAMSETDQRQRHGTHGAH